MPFTIYKDNELSTYLRRCCVYWQDGLFTRHACLLKWAELSNDEQIHVVQTLVEMFLSELLRAKQTCSRTTWHACGTWANKSIGRSSQGASFNFPFEMPWQFTESPRGFLCRHVCDWLSRNTRHVLSKLMDKSIPDVNVGLSCKFEFVRTSRKIISDTTDNDSSWLNILMESRRNSCMFTSFNMYEDKIANTSATRRASPHRSIFAIQIYPDI